MSLLWQTEHQELVDLSLIAAPNILLYSCSKNQPILTLEIPEPETEKRNVKNDCCCERVPGGGGTYRPLLKMASIKGGLWGRQHQQH